MRHSGILRSWHEDRGFGFIAPTQGGRELFVHISALPRDGTQPTVGETLSYELGRGPDGKVQAMRVLRQAVGTPVRRTQVAPTQRKPRASRTPKLIMAVLILALGGYGYAKYEQRLSKYTQDPQPLATGEWAPTVPSAAPSRFSCDGRKHCSQMSSCAEATFFLKNCPDTMMDGDGDGVPCEQQWCTSPFAK